MLMQMSKAKLSPWNNRWTEIFDFTPNKYGSGPNHQVLIDAKNPEILVDLHSFQKVVKKYETKKNTQMNDLKDLEAIFGDDSFYKDTANSQIELDDIEP